jgi:hypothetical protein
MEGNEGHISSRIKLQGSISWHLALSYVPFNNFGIEVWWSGELNEASSCMARRVPT